MADKKEDKALADIRTANEAAQKRANDTMLKEDEEKAMDAEEKASRKPPVAGIAAAPAIVIQPPKLISRTGGMPISRGEEASTHWAVGFEHCPDAQMAIDAAPRLLWQVQSKLKRFDTIDFHEQFYNWEIRVRVMRIDKDLQLVLVSPIGLVTNHSIIQAPVDLSQIAIVNRGAIGKWSWIAEPNTPRARVLKDGFETEELARYELKQKIARAA